MKYAVPFVLLILALILEGVIVSIPFVLIYIICISPFVNPKYLYLISFFSGLILDILLVREVGISSLMFLIVSLILVMYDKNFIRRSMIFVLLISVITTIFYVLIFNYPRIMLQEVFVVLLSLILFSIFSLLSKSKNTTLLDETSRGFWRAN